MDPSDPCKLFVLRGLQSDTEAVNAGLSIGPELIGCQGSRISLYRDLRIGQDTVIFPDKLHKAADRLPRQQRRRAAAPEYGNHLIVFVPVCRCPDLPFQQVYITLHCFLRITCRRSGPAVILRSQNGKRQEITVEAFPDTKRNVNVNA